MGRVAGVFDNPPGFPCTPPGVDILEGGKLTSNNVAGSSHDPLQSPAVASGAVSKPGGDTAGQDALHSAGVEGPEDSLKVYVAAIAANHDPVDGKLVGKHDWVIRFLRGARRLNPPRPPSIPSWDLSLVLRALQQGPFEPCKQSS